MRGVPARGPCRGARGCCLLAAQLRFVVLGIHDRAEPGRVVADRGSEDFGFGGDAGLDWCCFVLAMYSSFFKVS